MRNLLLVLLFTLVNIYWVVNDHTLPAIGDDARWLQESANITATAATGNWELISQKWQNMFITETTSVPRTPLFTLLSLPTFLIIGVNEDAALITNILLTAITSVFLGLLVTELFGHKAYKGQLATLSIVIFNLLPATYGLSRLYMSEMLQAFFVILITWLYLKFRHDLKLRNYLLLGILWGAALLLRILMPIYLLIPTIFFIKWQLELKKPKAQYILALILLLIPAFLLAATWYGPNWNIYFSFVGETSLGDIGSVTSLGPVYSPLTWLKYCKVILLWHFGWPLLLLLVLALAHYGYMIYAKGLLGTLIRDRMVNLIKENFVITKIKHIYNAKLFLFLSAIPALIVTTASDNKTARYFFPAEVFLVVLISYFVFKLWDSNRLWARIAVIAGLGLCLYPFLQSITPTLPKLPATNLMYTSDVFQTEDPDLSKYDFVFENLKLNQGKYFVVPETIGFNDAELIWYARQQGVALTSLGEFSLYTTLEQGLQKVREADIVILHSGVTLNSEQAMSKYLDLKKTIKEEASFKSLGANIYDDGTSLELFVK